MTITEVRKIVGAQLGLSGYDGSAAATGSLSDADKLAIYNGTAAYVLAHQADFTLSQVSLATSYLTRGGNGGVETYGVTDAASDFVLEMANQAEEINPLSERNRGSLSWYLMLLGFVAVALYFAGRSGLAKQVMEARK
jgi:hypothetical protein